MKKDKGVNPNTSNKKSFKLEHWQVVAMFLMLFDAVAVTGAYFIALWFRFDCNYTEIPVNYFLAFLKFAPINIVATIGIFWIFKLYRSLWKYASYKELQISSTVCCKKPACIFSPLMHICGCPSFQLLDIQ